MALQVKNLVLGGAIAIAVFVGLQFAKRNSGSGLFGNASPNRAQLEQLILDSAESTGTAGFYPMLKDKFPQEYDRFMDQMFMDQMVETIASAGGNAEVAEQIAFTKSQAFTVGLRQENANYLATAPMENLRSMNKACLDLLKSTQADPDLCAQLANGGGGSLSLEQTGAIDVALVGNTSTQTFLAMAAGRDTPVTQDVATPDDINAFFVKWQAFPDTTAAQYDALAQTNTNPADVCAANISFAEYLQSDDTELGA